MSKRQVFKFYKSYYDVLQEIPEAEQLKFLKALFEKQFFGKEPELTGLAKLVYVSQKHSIDKQVKGFEDKIGEQLKHPNIDPMQGGSEGGSVGPSLQLQLEIQLKEQLELELEKKEKKFSFKNSLVEYGFKLELVEQWLQVRKNKKATNTEIAFKKFVQEIEKQTCDINEILELIISKSWSGFKWEWIENQQNKANGQQTISKAEQIIGGTQWVKDKLAERRAKQQ